MCQSNVNHIAPFQAPVYEGERRQGLTYDTGVAHSILLIAKGISLGVTENRTPLRTGRARNDFLHLIREGCWTTTLQLASGSWVSKP